MNTAVVNTQSVVLSKYGIASPFYGSESREDILKLRDCANLFFKDQATKDNLPDEATYPARWKLLLDPWFVANAPGNNVPARDILRRPDVTTPDHLFTRLLARVNSSTTQISDKYRKMLMRVCEFSSMDTHLSTLHEYFTDNFTEMFQPELENSIAANHTTSLILDDPRFAADFDRNVTTRLLRAELVASIVVQNAAVIQTFKTNYVERSCRVVLQGMISAIPDLLKDLEPGEVPLNATSFELADWFQRILNNKQMKIAMRTSENANPLQKIAVNIQQVFPTQIAQNDEQFARDNYRFKKERKLANQYQGQTIQAMAQNPAFTNPPHLQRPGSNVSFGGPNRNNNFTQKNGKPPGGKFTKPPLPVIKPLFNRHCAFCMTLYPLNKRAYSNHDHQFCFRDPSNRHYDAKKASYPPKN